MFTSRGIQLLCVIIFVNVCLIMADQKSEDYLQKLFSQSGNEPIDGDSGEVEIQLPQWFNVELFKKGQKLYFKYVVAMAGGMKVGLLAVLAIPSILEVLICTNKSSTNVDAYRRYIRTLHHVISWHISEMKPGTKAWQSIAMVRKIHTSSRKMCERTQRITIMQRDMALTQFGFMGFVVLKPQMFGIPIGVDFFEATVHFWRVIGHLMGIKDELNLCTDSYETTKARLQSVLESVFKPALENTDSKFDVMSKALLDGLWHTNYMLSFKPYVHFAKRIAGCKGYEYFKSDFKKPPTKADLKTLKYRELSWFENAQLFYYIFMHEYLYPISIFKFFFNFKSKISFIFDFYFPASAIFSFGFKKAYVRIFHGESADPDLHYD